LATAILSEPLAKIRHTCEALMLLGEDERESAGISTGEVKEAKRIYRLAITLQNAYIDKFRNEYGEVIERSATIPWPFAREEAGEWLEWIPFITWRLYKERTDNAETYEKASELSEEGKMEESLYVATRDRVTICTLNRVKSQFTNYAMPKATKLLKKIITVVSSSSFQAAMDRLKGGASGSRG
ncbi:hypothetical protein AKJ55_02005, partial [candidate division MSBL1 archaeon SCGC-AAA382M17]